MKIQVLLLFFVSILLFTACEKESPNYRSTEPVLPEVPLAYTDFEAPSWVATHPFLADIDNASATLGRVLFYDTKLSVTNNISCGTCHQQNKAFSSNVAFDAGFSGELTRRNTKALVNPVTQANFFWDGREDTLAVMAVQPIFDHFEMGMESEEMLIQKMEKTTYYSKLFQEAFGDTQINKERIGLALSQFMRSMLSFSSKYDEFRAVGTEENPVFSELEEAGHDLFRGEAQCSQCHSSSLFSSYYTANIGLDLEYEDNGVGELWPNRDGEFQIPSVRNIALTAPYMHDGRFNTLEEVVEHYSSQIKPHPNLSGVFTSWSGDPQQGNFSEYEKSALVAFLKTLTDEKITTDERFSDPFED